MPSFLNGAVPVFDPGSGDARPSLLNAGVSLADAADANLAALRAGAVAVSQAGADAVGRPAPTTLFEPRNRFVDNPVGTERISPELTNPSVGIDPIIGRFPGTNRPMLASEAADLRARAQDVVAGTLGMSGTLEGRGVGGAPMSSEDIAGAPGEGFTGGAGWMPYKGGAAAKDLNFRLREGLPLTDENKALLGDVMSRMQPTTEDKMLWRGIGGGGDFFYKPVGSVVNDPGLLSTSTSMGQAGVFANHPNPTLLRLSVPKGTPALDLSAHSEGEWVLPAGYDFHLTDRIPVPMREGTGLRYTIIGAKMLPKAQP